MVLRRQLEIPVDVALGVDDDGVARPGASHEVRELRELRIDNLTDKHSILR
jgi:hypothetical protein